MTPTSLFYIFINRQFSGGQRRLPFSYHPGRGGDMRKMMIAVLLLGLVGCAYQEADPKIYLRSAGEEFANAAATKDMRERCIRLDRAFHDSWTALYFAQNEDSLGSSYVRSLTEYQQMLKMSAEALGGPLSQCKRYLAAREHWEAAKVIYKMPAPENSDMTQTAP